MRDYSLEICIRVWIDVFSFDQLKTGLSQCHIHRLYSCFGEGTMISFYHCVTFVFLARFVCVEKK